MAGDATPPRYRIVHMNVQTGERLGPYRIQERVGEGGMGVVHRAHDPEGRVVAIKILRPQVAGDATARRRLAREVETMRRVRSPHVAEVLDADVSGEVPYVVTRYVPARPLDELVDDGGPLRGRALTRVAAGLTEALSAVHAAGVVHRDLKPGNVLLVDGEPVIIDFGIAQAIDTTRLTQTGMFIGTPGYLAPEVIQGHDSIPASDVHAWAATVAFAATGRPPFGAGPFEAVFYRIVQGQHDLAGVAAPLVPLLHAALATDPRARPPANQLDDQVRRLHQGQDHLAAPAAGAATAVPPTRTFPRGPEDFSDVLPPVAYGEPPKPAPAPATRPRPRSSPGHHPLLCLGLLAIVAGLTATLPVVGTLGGLAAVVVLRAADRAQSKLAVRRSARGPSASDAVVVALGTPWGLARGALVTGLLAPVAGVLALVAGVLLAYALRGVTLNTVGAFAAAAFVALLCAGPGAGAVRRQANRMVGAVARTPQVTVVIAVAVGVLAVIALAGALSQAPVWWPLPPPEQGLARLAEGARGAFGDWLRERLPDWQPRATGG